jgi:hypothetical protein
MKSKIKLATGLLLLFLVNISCSLETETHEITTPVLELKAVGPLFEGSNTATATWEFALSELFSDLEGEINIHDVQITAINVKPRANQDFPKVEKMVMEMKSKYTSMTRIGLLESNMQPNKSYDLQIAGKQEELKTAFEDERITFVGDFDMIDEDFYEDVVFDLQVTFRVETRK